MLPRAKSIGLGLMLWVLTGQGVPADESRTVHLVSRIVGQNFLSETIRIGDLNGDGAPDILFVQNLYGPRIITCLTAATLAGEVLWQTGVPSKDNGRAYGDLPVQIYDWDRDGTNEVLYVLQATYLDAPAPVAQNIRERAPRYEGNATLRVLDGRTGREKARFALPAPADDSFLFADLTGRGRREDLVDEFPLQVARLPGEKEFCGDCYGMAADVWGDSRDEVVLFGSRGFCVYANTRPYEKPSLYNMNLYPGM
jgi:hypothetical protein